MTLRTLRSQRAEGSAITKKPILLQTFEADRHAGQPLLLCVKDDRRPVAFKLGGVPIIPKPAQS